MNNDQDKRTDPDDNSLDLSALEAAVAELGIEDMDDGPASPPPARNHGLDLTEAPPAADAGAGRSVFDMPLPDGIEIPDFSGSSLVGSAAEPPEPEPRRAPATPQPATPRPAPPTSAPAPDPVADVASASSALRELGVVEQVASPPEPEPEPEPEPAPAIDSSLSLENYTAQGGRIKGGLKAVKGSLGR